MWVRLWKQTMTKTPLLWNTCFGQFTSLNTSHWKVTYARSFPDSKFCCLQAGKIALYYIKSKPRVWTNMTPTFVKPVGKLMNQSTTSTVRYQIRCLNLISEENSNLFAESKKNKICLINIRRPIQMKPNQHDVDPRIGSAT